MISHLSCLVLAGTPHSFICIFSPSLRKLSVLSGGVIYVFFYWIPLLCLNWIWQWCLAFLCFIGSIKTGLIWSALILRQSNTVEDMAKECDLWNHLACAILENEKARDWQGGLPTKSACAKNVTALLNGKFLLRVNYSRKASQEVKRAHRTVRARYRLFS